MANMQIEFEKWLRSGSKADGNKYSQETINGYVSSLRTHASKLSDVKLPTPNLFQIDSSQDFESVYVLIKNSKDFASVNSAYHRIFSSALKTYKAFLSEKDVGVVVNNASLFADWLRSYTNHKYNESTVKRYVKALEKSEEWLGVKLEQTVLSTSDSVAFNNLQGIIKSLPNYEQVNQSHGHGDLSAALRLYGLYLQDVSLEIDSATTWWPSIAEYNPEISKEKWLELLNNPEIFSKDRLIMMAQFYNLGGQASCALMADTYGKTSDYYRMACGVHLAEKIAKETGCPLCNQENAKFWPVLFVGRNAKLDERGNYIWKLRDELYEALGDFGIGKYEVTFKGGEKEMTIKEKVAAIKAYIASKGFNYEGDLIENFYLSLKSKPFVILAGTSGTGKTRLVKLFAEAIGAKMKMVPVRPDWSDSSDLFGHTDLSNRFHPGAIIDFIKQAEWNKDVPHFLCLDEMNLARVEYYLSDFLSIIETRDRRDNSAIETDPLVDVSYYKDIEARDKYGRVYIPENLYIIGTVNMDETTFPFSKKVLDRANTIEFSFVNLMSRTAVDGSPLANKLDNSFLKTKYLYLRDCDDEELIDQICFNLEELNHILVKANLHVGYRVRDEISFYMMNNKVADLIPEDAAFDHEIMQKILPRIQGSSAAIKAVLSELFMKCAGDFSGFAGTATYEQMSSYIDSKPCKYPNSAKKIAFMMRRYEEDGFTSYWL